MKHETCESRQQSLLIHNEAACLNDLIYSLGLLLTHKNNCFIYTLRIYTRACELSAVQSRPGGGEHDSAS